MTGDLRRVLVRPPLAEDVMEWQAAGWRAAPDPVAAAREHEAFCLLLGEAGAEVVVSQHDPGNPDALYPYDPVLVGEEGAVLLRPGKVGRRGEPNALVPSLEDAGVPVAAILGGPALAEGGDTLWLDEFDEDVTPTAPLANGRRWEEMGAYYFFLLAQSVGEGWDATFAGARRPYFMARGMGAGAHAR